jgi:hypothetical protein
LLAWSSWILLRPAARSSRFLIHDILIARGSHPPPFGLHPLDHHLVQLPGRLGRHRPTFLHRCHRLHGDDAAPEICEQENGQIRLPVGYRLSIHTGVALTAATSTTLETVALLPKPNIAATIARTMGIDAKASDAPKSVQVSMSDGSVLRSGSPSKIPCMGMLLYRVRGPPAHCGQDSRVNCQRLFPWDFGSPKICICLKADRGTRLNVPMPDLAGVRRRARSLNCNDEAATREPHKRHQNGRVASSARASSLIMCRHHPTPAQTPDLRCRSRCGANAAVRSATTCYTRL